MATKYEFTQQVRSVGGYTSEETLSDDKLDNLIERAQNHLRSRGAVEATSPDWYADEKVNEALFWTTLLFTKVATGELDAQALTTGAIDRGSLLAKADDEVTTWYRNYRDALAQLNAAASMGHTTSNRTSQSGPRQYGSSDIDYDPGGGGGTGDL